ncbi:MAG: thiamine pyrophosphate-dependent enzyme [Povalibacter sp.]
MSANASTLLLDVLQRWGVDTIFGLPGDGINGVMEAIRLRSNEFRFIQVRHEESAAFMACAYAKLTGRLGCCLATSGPGGVHLLNGLYDAKADDVPVLALTGLPYHDLIDTFTQQDIDHGKLFSDVAIYSARVMSAAHVENVANLACRLALTRRGVTHLALPTDVQEQTLDEATRSMRNVEGHNSQAMADARQVPTEEALQRAADILNQAQRVTILAGGGALHAGDALEKVAEKLGAPIVKALLGKAAIADQNNLVTGGIGLLGTRPSQEAMDKCDALLIVGSRFPYIEYYPKPGQARTVQIDRDPAYIGLRAPAEAALIGDARATLEMLEWKVNRKEDRSFLNSIQERMQDWRQLLQQVGDADDFPLKPGRVALELGRRLPSNAIVAWDSGHNTGLCARYIDAIESQVFFGSGMMASMACAIPYAIAAALAYRDRPVFAFVGDGGLSMLLGELATIVRYRLPIKIVVVKNNTLGQIKWEQMLFLGHPEYECELQPIDFAKVAEAMGIAAFRVESAGEYGSVLDQALAVTGPALIEAPIDPNEPLLPPKHIPKYASNLRKALEEDTPGREDIEHALASEPARTLWQGMQH